jgi:hypothetical protein
MPHEMQRVVPTISSTVVGPLGIPHLPRMWHKGLLVAVDALGEGYLYGNRGFEEVIMAGVGIDPPSFLAHLATMPAYPETERWVAAHATKLDPASVAATATHVWTYVKPEERAAPVRARVGLKDASVAGSAVLNDLEDWCTVHEWLAARRGEAIAPIVPGVSSSSSGPLGIKHLPRLWMKATLAAVGALPDGWNSGFGFDRFVAETIGLDLAAAVAHIHAELPPYLAFEDWVRAHVEGLDAAAIARHNTAITSRTKSAEKSVEECAEIGIPATATTNVIELNDLLDWKALHEAALARRALAR